MNWGGSVGDTCEDEERRGERAGDEDWLARGGAYFAGQSHSGVSVGKF